MSQALASDPFVPTLYRVGRVQRELPDTVTLELAPLAGARLEYAPGQFNMIYVFGGGEVAISMSGDPVSGPLVHTVRDVGRVSGAICRLQPGSMVGIRGPFGAAWPIEQSEGADVLIVAGGLGLAPVRPAIYHVLANRQKYGRVAILAGSRDPSDILFRDQLEEWRHRLDLQVEVTSVRAALREKLHWQQRRHTQIEVTVDYADTDWRGNVGAVPALVDRAAFDPQETVAMVCGPEVLMLYTATALQGAGVPAERIWLSMERNMKCAIGLCGHCQFGPDFVCKDGPVMSLDHLGGMLTLREV